MHTTKHIGLKNRGGKDMTKIKNYVSWMAPAIATLLGWLALLSANSGSCCMINEPEAPKAMDKFRKLK